MASPSKPDHLSATESQCLSCCPHIRDESNQIWRETEFAEPGERDRAWSRTEEHFRSLMAGCPGPLAIEVREKVPYRLKWLRAKLHMPTHKLVPVARYCCGKDH